MSTERFALVVSLMTLKTVRIRNKLLRKGNVHAIEDYTMETCVAIFVIVATFGVYRCTKGSAAFETCIAGAAVAATGLVGGYAGSVVAAFVLAIRAACLGGFHQLSVRSRAWLSQAVSRGTYHHTERTQGHSWPGVCLEAPS